ncbi:MAG: hypothetical protein IID15_02450 [Candidatus Marinimicrobia bacterium]|nr:hypothetical protein [Candidatus Neomarinimicrobiota bacterium]
MDKVAAPLMLTVSLMALSCQSDITVMLAENDLFGRWRSTTINGVAEIAFSQTEGLNRYIFSAPDGDFGDIVLLPGTNVLSQGLWGLAGNVLALVDEDGFPLACPETVQFVVEMSSSGLAFTLASVDTGDNICLTRSQIMGESGWLAVAEEES